MEGRMRPLEQRLEKKVEPNRKGRRVRIKNGKDREENWINADWELGRNYKESKCGGKGNRKKGKVGKKGRFKGE